MKNRQYLSPILLTFILLLLLIAIGSIAYLSTYTRLHADDFCIAADAQSMMPFSFFVDWYTGWTGRFTYIALAGLFSLGGASLASWLPTFSIIIWFIGLAWVYHPITSKLNWKHPFLTASLLSSITLLVLFSATPNLFQSIYWKDGLINYGYPLIGFTFLSGLLLRVMISKRTEWKYTSILFLLAFFSGGFSEVFSVTQVAFFLVLLTGHLIFTRKMYTKILPALIAALIGALAALTIVYLAPGNQVRQEIIADHPGIIRLVTFSFRNAVYIIAKYLIQTPGWALFSILAPFTLSWLLSKGEDNSGKFNKKNLWNQPWFKWVAIPPIFAFAMVYAACFPVVYMMNAYPDDRTIIIPLFFVLLSVIIASIFLGIGAKKLTSQSALWKKPTPSALISLTVTWTMIIAMMMAAVFSTIAAVNRVPEYRNYAQLWDRRHAELLDISDMEAEEAVVYGLESRFGLADLREEPEYWVNQCMADYYGLSQVGGR